MNVVRTGSAPRGPLELLAVGLLLIGGVVVPVIGWVVGVVLLWASKAWTMRQKLLGTLVVPGGFMTLAIFAYFPIGSYCVTGSDGSSVCPNAVPVAATIPLTVLLIVGPVLTAFYLLQTATRHNQ